MTQFKVFESKKSLMSQFGRIDFVKSGLILLIMLISLHLQSQCSTTVKMNAKDLISQMKVQLITRCKSNVRWISKIELYKCSEGDLIAIMFTKSNLYKFKINTESDYSDWCASDNHSDYYYEHIKGNEDYSFERLYRCLNISSGGRHCSNVASEDDRRCWQHKRR